MDRHIKTDIEQGFQYFKAGIYNIINPIQNGDETEYILVRTISPLLLYSLLKELYPKIDILVGDSYFQINNVIINITADNYKFHI